MDSSKDNILFICKNNSSRSQMAEAILNSIYGEKYNVFSGGLEPTKVNKYAIKSLKEINIDITENYSKNLDIFKNKEFKYVITLCDDGKCPYFPNSEKNIHKSFKDPNRIEGNEEDIFNEFRKCRNEIKKWIIDMIENGVI